MSTAKTDWENEYLALNESAGIADISCWNKFLFAGTDRKKFLNGLLTNDVLNLKPMSGFPVCLLTPKGKLQAYFELYDIGEKLLAFCPAESSGNLRGAISKVIALGRTQMEEISGRSRLYYLVGPKSGAMLRALLGPLPFLDSHSVYALAWKGMEILISAHRWRHPDGYLVLVLGGSPESLYRELLESGESRGLAVIGPETLNALRIEAGLPIFGVDMDGETIPFEARLEGAISFSKGCYMGQETVSRVHHMGHVNKILVKLRLAGESVPSAPAKVFGQGREIGRMTSATWSPRFNSVIALGTVRVEFSNTGDRIEIQEDKSFRQAEVLPW